MAITLKNNFNYIRNICHRSSHYHYLQINFRYFVAAILFPELSNYFGKCDVIITEEMMAKAKPAVSTKLTYQVFTSTRYQTVSYLHIHHTMEQLSVHLGPFL